MSSSPTAPSGWRRWLHPPSLKPEEKDAALSALVDGAVATRRFFILLGLSATIASFGLLSNSAAVIIGAMIVAPLMGPILGLSLGMVQGDHKLERRALFTEVLGVAMAIAIGYAVGNVPLSLGIGTEMIARTSPTIFDLCIAFVSGLAGGYASVSRKVNSTLAGVAIAVALVPPLCTSGLLLAMGHPDQSLGALLLFLGNFFSIQLASAIVFWIYGLGRVPGASTSSFSRLAIRFAPGLAALFAMGWFMTGTLAALVRAHDLEERVRSVLSEQIARRTGGRLDKILRNEPSGAVYRVVASALTPSVFDANQVAQIEANLSDALHRPVRLVLRSIVSQDMDRKGRVYLTDAERQRDESNSSEAAFLQRARTILEGSLYQVDGVRITDLERRESEGTITLIATVQTPASISPPQVAEAQHTIAEVLSQPIRLVLRVVNVRDVAENGYLHTGTASRSLREGRFP